MTCYEIKTNEGNLVVTNLKEVNRLREQKIEIESVKMIVEIEGNIREHKLF